VGQVVRTGGAPCFVAAMVTFFIAGVLISSAQSDIDNGVRTASRLETSQAC